MHVRAMAVVLAIGVLGVAAGAASASRLSFSNANFRLAMQAFQLTLGEFEVTCAATLEGSFHGRTIAKVAGASVGAITRAPVNASSCRGGSIQLLAEGLPWNVRYRSFTGALPTITSVALDLVGFALLFEVPPFVGCLFASTEARPASGRLVVAAGGAIQRFDFSPEARIPLLRRLGLLACPESLSLEQSATVSLLGTTTAITVRLI